METTSRPQPSLRQAALLARVERLFRDSACEPPSVSEVVHAIGAPPDAITAMISLGLSAGSLVQIADGLTFHADVIADTKLAIADDISRNGYTTVARVRDLLRSSRKFVVPLLEFLAQEGFTERQGDRRVLAIAPGDAPVAER